MSRSRIHLGGRRVGFTLALCLAASSAHAHLLPPNLALFGPFGAPTVRCLRTLSLAAQRCFAVALATQRDCMSQQLSGGVCDRATRDARIDTAKQAARDAVVNTCLGGQLTGLRFVSFDEAETDVTARVCSDQVDAAMSMIELPAGAASTAAVTEPVRQCMVETGLVSQKLLRLAVQLKSAALDRMAVHVLGPSQKFALLSIAGKRLAAAQQALTQRLTESCTDFESIYGRAPAAYLARLIPRADCIVSDTYVQTQIMCPQPVCGNGIKEPGEQCDDGNTINNDGCRNDCTLGP